MFTEKWDYLNIEICQIARTACASLQTLLKIDLKLQEIILSLK